MNFGSKGMTCLQFVNLMRERGYTYNQETGRFITGKGTIAGKETRNGYRILTLQKDKVIYTFCEHRCVWVWFNGEIPDGKVINHIDADRSNNKIENLEVVTQKENMHHMIELGRQNPSRGINGYRATYSDLDVMAMRYLRHQHGWPVKNIARLFDAKNVNVIGRLINGRRYGHVTNDISVRDVYFNIVSRAIDQGVMI